MEVNVLKPDACQSIQFASIQSIKTSNCTQFSNKDIDNKKGIQGFFHKAIPIMPKPLAITCCFLNIFVPGLGKTFSLILHEFC